MRVEKGPREDNVDLLPRVHMDDDENEVVDEFVYLMTTGNDTNREIQWRIVTENRAYFGRGKTLRSNKVPHRTKMTISKALIRPIVLLRPQDCQWKTVCGEDELQKEISENFFRLRLP